MIFCFFCSLKIIADQFWAYDRSKDFEETISVAFCCDSNYFAEKEELTQQQRKNHACCEKQKAFLNAFSEKWRWELSEWFLSCSTDQWFSINHTLKIQIIIAIIVLLTFISSSKYFSLLEFHSFIIIINTAYNWCK